MCKCVIEIFVCTFLLPRLCERVVFDIFFIRSVRSSIHFHYIFFFFILNFVLQIAKKIAALFCSISFSQSVSLFGRFSEILMKDRKYAMTRYTTYKIQYFIFIFSIRFLFCFQFLLHACVCECAYLFCVVCFIEITIEGVYFLFFCMCLLILPFDIFDERFCL